MTNNDSKLLFLKKLDAYVKRITEWKEDAINLWQDVRLNMNKGLPNHTINWKTDMRGSELLKKSAEVISELDKLVHRIKVLEYAIKTEDDDDD